VSRRPQLLENLCDQRQVVAGMGSSTENCSWRRIVPHDADDVLITNLFRVERVFEQDRSGTPSQRFIVRHPGAVAIVAMVDADHVCLIRNFRIAVNREMIELPAGIIEQHEQPAQTAIRELLEETGYLAEHVTEFATLCTSPGFTDERIYLFRAEGLQAADALREPGERIQKLVVPWAKALELVFDGTIQDAKTAAGLLLCDKLRSAP
jgi:ADP-ribose pyrophosphatase